MSLGGSIPIDRGPYGPDCPTAIRALDRRDGYVDRAMGLLSSAATVTMFVLGAAGWAKVRDPAPLGAALFSLGWRVPRWAVRTLGVAEMSLAAIGVMSAAPIVLVVVSVIHGAFAVLILRMISSDNDSSCGCFGARAAAPSWVGVVMNAGSAAVLAAAGLSNVAPIRPEGVTTWVLVALMIVLAWTVVSIHTTGSDLAASIRRLRVRSDWSTPIPIATRGR